MKTLHELDNEQAYEQALGRCVGVTGYHHWFFLTALAEALGLKFRALEVSAGGERLGVVPLLFRRRGVVSTLNYLPVGCIGPLLSESALLEGRARELLEAAEPVVRRHLTVVTNWAFSPGLKLSAGSLAMPGYTVVESDNYMLPAAKSVDDCLKAMSRVRRQSIRQSEGHGLSVSDSTSGEITTWLPGQIGGAFRRQGAPPSYTPSQIHVLAERLAAHPRMLWRTVRAADGDILGITGSVVGDGRLWGWLMVGPPSPGVSAHTLSYWDMIKWSRAQGLAYDFGGVPSEGIRKFKVSLGAEAESCVSAMRTRPAALYKAGRAAYNWALARRAPTAAG